MKTAEMKVTYLDSLGTDLSVVNAARVSFHKESDWEYDGDDDVIHTLKEQDVKLIRYLSTQNHWSPFVHTSVSLRILAPIFVARQLVKHQVGGAWNEVSRRYVAEEPVFYFPRSWRGKPVNAKQGSDGEVENQDAVHNAASFCTQDCLDLYNNMILDGVAPEQARMILPQNTMTEWIWTGSLYFFARVCKLRLDPHAQEETSEVARQIADIMVDLFPVSWDALMNHSQGETK